jgi:hypothetical protein
MPPRNSTKAPVEAASMPAPFDRECEFEVEHRAAVVPDFNRQLLAIAA